uniref:AlNc14C64G4583 protein n=1 Tax=Albugo laibachii Nc14 TaxID=890382 RepID=F0WD63_9STRA|nr:AlNc14C64G4583 [Albugo laibachii Nc14]|eukprot:CCA19135.1 AlNc14C64G4583 [Albugo laibachii Nc14]
MTLTHDIYILDNTKVLRRNDLLEAPRDAWIRDKIFRYTHRLPSILFNRDKVSATDKFSRPKRIYACDETRTRSTVYVSTRRKTSITLHFIDVKRNEFMAHDSEALLKPIV